MKNFRKAFPFEIYQNLFPRISWIGKIYLSLGFTKFYFMTHCWKRLNLVFCNMRREFNYFLNALYILNLNITINYKLTNLSRFVLGRTRKWTITDFFLISMSWPLQNFLWWVLLVWNIYELLHVVLFISLKFFFFFF